MSEFVFSVKRMDVFFRAVEKTADALEDPLDEIARDDVATVSRAVLLTLARLPASERDAFLAAALKFEEEPERDT